VHGLAARVAYVKQAMRDKRDEHRQYIAARGENMPEVRDWRRGA
jgi:xylulose-5-phosphate/fructose-6-phosphate phosphoketolase